MAGLAQLKFYVVAEYDDKRWMKQQMKCNFFFFFPPDSNDKKKKKL